MAPEVTVSREHSKQIQAYIAGITMEAMVLRVDVVQESRRAWLPTVEWELLHDVYITKIDAH